MSGLEKMMQKIEADAQVQADEIAAKAQAKSAEILADAQAAGQAKSAELAEKSTRDVASYQERVKSSLEQQRRTALLRARQEIITTLLNRAYEALCQKPDAEYFPFLKQMLEKFALPEPGEICFSLQDLARMPAGYLEELQAIAQQKGGSLTLSKETRETGGGFVLIYGGIEENCTFKALFDAKREALQDQVHGLLFT